MEARFPSYCEECEHPIRVGDEIMPTDDGEWTHAKCSPPPDPLPLGTICGTCWMQQPCDCDVKEDWLHARADRIEREDA